VSTPLPAILNYQPLFPDPFVIVKLPPAALFKPPEDAPDTVTLLNVALPLALFRISIPYVPAPAIVQLENVAPVQPFGPMMRMPQ
jgi:hypothetical protein